jgi:hypothetical protein
MASKTDLPSLDCDLSESDRTVPELAPVIPSSFLRRVSRQLPVVVEATHLIGNWYLFLSHMFYEEIRGKMSPGALDENLDRMFHWLKEVKGESYRRLHAERAEPRTTKEQLDDNVKEASRKWFAWRADLARTNPKIAEDMTQEQKALNVIVLTHETSEYLAEHDPQALKQCQEAISGCSWQNFLC